MVYYCNNKHNLDYLVKIGLLPLPKSPHGLYLCGIEIQNDILLHMGYYRTVLKTKIGLPGEKLDYIVLPSLNATLDCMLLDFTYNYVELKHIMTDHDRVLHYLVKNGVGNSINHKPTIY